MSIRLYPSPGASAVTAGAPNMGRFVGVTASGSPTSGTYAVGDFVTTQNGQMLVCVVAGTPGTWVTPSDTRNLLATGEETLPRDLVTNSGGITMTSGTLRLTFFTARKTETTTQVRVISGGTAAGATPTLCRVGLYAVDATGDGTLVASIPNDTALFATQLTAYTRSWSVALAKVAGIRYALGDLVVTGATAPTLVGAIPVSSAELAVAPRLSGILTGQTDLPAGFTEAGLTATTTRVYGAVLP